MPPTKKRTWKFWVSRTLLLVLLIGSIWLVNLIWFRPFSIGQFYDREFINLALRSPETVTQLGVPVLYDLTKDKWDDVSDTRLRSDFQKTKETYATLQSYDFDSQSDANNRTAERLNTKILGWLYKKRTGWRAVLLLYVSAQSDVWCAKRYAKLTRQQP